MVLEAKRHRESYERRFYRKQNTKQDRDNIFRAKTDRSLV